MQKSGPGQAMNCRRIAPGLFFVLLCLVFATAHAQRARYERAAPAEKHFVDVVLDLRQSIGAHNFAVVGHNEIGQAVRQRGHPAFPDAAIVHFCNLEYARRVMAIEPTMILYMPCRIAVFERDGSTHAASLLLPTDTAFADFNRLATEVNRQIREIVDYAVAPTISPDSD